MTEAIQAVIFDFDGLLMDTESTSIASWQREWGRWGLELDRETFFAPHGGDITEQRYEALAAAVGASYDREISHTRRTQDRDELNAALVLADGLEEWLAEARTIGLRTAVASSSDVAWVEQFLRRVGVVDEFDVVVGGDLVAAHKPAPDVYRLALTRLGMDGHQAVAVEDTPHGVDAAHAAGLPCIAIPNPHVAADRVSHAEVILQSAAMCTLIEALDKVRAAETLSSSQDSGRS